MYVEAAQNTIKSMDQRVADDCVVQFFRSSDIRSSVAKDGSVHGSRPTAAFYAIGAAMRRSRWMTGCGTLGSRHSMDGRNTGQNDDIGSESKEEVHIFLLRSFFQVYFPIKIFFSVSKLP